MVYDCIDVFLFIDWERERGKLILIIPNDEAGLLVTNDDDDDFGPRLLVKSRSLSSSSSAIGRFFANGARTDLKLIKEKE